MLGLWVLSKKVLLTYQPLFNSVLRKDVTCLVTGTVIPAMVQRLRFSINVQHLSHHFTVFRISAVGAVAKNT